MNAQTLDRRFEIPLSLCFALSMMVFTSTLLAFEVGDPIEQNSLERARDATVVPSDESAESKPCVLLKNDNLLFGVARQVGSFVIVNTSEGSEIKLKHQEVLCWADSPRDLYRYRVDHRQSGDVPVMLKDARWCIRYGLYDLAAREIVAANRIAPNAHEVVSAEAHLRRAWDQHTLKTRAATLSSLPSSSMSVQDKKQHFVFESDSHESKLASDLSHEPQSGDAQDEFASGILEHDPRLIGYFASHIQPMLVNRCGICHGQGADGAEQSGWPLLVPAVGARASATMTRENLQSVIAYVDQLEPAVSPLFVKATEPHGGGEAALNVRNTAAVESLRQWTDQVAMVLRRSDHLESPVHSNVAHGSGSNQQKGRVLKPKNHHKDALTRGTGILASADPTSPAYGSVVRRVGPSRLPLVSNPFDPDLFNRQLELSVKSD